MGQNNMGNSLDYFQGKISELPSIFWLVINMKRNEPEMETNEPEKVCIF